MPDEKHLVHTESRKISQLGRVIGHGAHEPIYSRLPHRVEDATEDIQEGFGGVV